MLLFSTAQIHRLNEICFRLLSFLNVTKRTLDKITTREKFNTTRGKQSLRNAPMASTAASLSCSSTAWLKDWSVSRHMSGDIARISDRGSVMVIFAQKKAKKVRKIILKDDVPDLGKKGELLDVKAGYYRNFLLPMGKAQIVTPLLLKEMKMEEERIETEKKRVKEEALQLALIFETVGAFKVKRKGGKGKQIFGTVTAQDLVDIIKAQIQRDVDKRIVNLPEIRETGEYMAELRLHPDVTARVRLNVFAN